MSTTLLNLTEAISPQPPGFFLAWAIVSNVSVAQNTAVVFFDLYGSPTVDAQSATNLKLARVGELNPGDKIMVARTGGGGWIILDRVVNVEEAN